MGRYRHKACEKAITPRWVAVFGLQWQFIESHRLEPAADLTGAMAQAIERLAAEGLQTEEEPRFGFAFVRRNGERRLLMLTRRSLRHRVAVFQPIQVVG